MCGRFTSTTSTDDLVAAFGVEEVSPALQAAPLPERFNVAPTQPVLAVATRRRPGERPVRQLGTFRWGLVPAWAPDPSAGARMINARAESLAERPAFREALARRRCLIPADGFYEWQGGAARQPWLIRRADGRPMAFAGLWEAWRDPARASGPPLRTCTIVTTAANPTLAAIHHRMPAVLPAGAWDTWLDPAVDDPAVLGGLLVPAPAEWFVAVPVSARVNRVDEDGPALVEPVQEPSRLALP